MKHVPSTYPGAIADALCVKCDGIIHHVLAATPGEAVKASDVIFPDGSKPKSGDLVKCQNCSTSEEAAI